MEVSIRRASINTENEHPFALAVFYFFLSPHSLLVLGFLEKMGTTSDGDRPWQSYHTAYTNAKAGSSILPRVYLGVDPLLRLFFLLFFTFLFLLIVGFLILALCLSLISCFSSFLFLFEPMYELFSCLDSKIRVACFYSATFSSVWVVFLVGVLGPDFSWNFVFFWLVLPESSGYFIEEIKNA